MVSFADGWLGGDAVGVDVGVAVGVGVGVGVGVCVGELVSVGEAVACCWLGSVQATANSVSPASNAMNRHPPLIYVQGIVRHEHKSRSVSAKNSC
jgi:hypothetical protein